MLDVASATFLAGERLDIVAIAESVALSRATVHRWFGSREHLLELVLGRIAGEFSAAARAESSGEGNERVVDFVRRLVTMAVEFEPVRSFITHEPQLALRLLIGIEGAVHREVVDAVIDMQSAESSASHGPDFESRVRVVIQVGATLLWGAIVAGEEPNIDGVADITRFILVSN